MTRKLTLDEVWKLTEAFALVPADDRPASSSILVKDFLDPEVCAGKMEALKEAVHYPDLKVTASTFTKNYAVETVALAFYAMSILNLKLNLAADNTYLDLQFVSAPRKARVALIQWEAEDLPDVLDQEARQRAIDSLVKDLFTGHIAPLWDLLQKTTHVNAQILWENLAERVYQFYEGDYRDLSLEALVRMKTDFAYLMEKVSAESFGAKWNPLSRFDIHDEYGYRTRKTCCLRYEVSRYCRECPLRKKRQ